MADNIHQAIAAIYGEVGYVQKQSTKGLNYSYASESALIEALRPAMVKHGVYVSVEDVKLLSEDTYKTKGENGTTMHLVRLLLTANFTHAESGTSVSVQAMGEGADTGDKAGNKAMTGAYKYALRQTFCIETGDDPDRTPSAEQERASNGKGSLDMMQLGNDLKELGIDFPRGLIANVTDNNVDAIKEPSAARKAVLAWAEKHGIADPADEILQRAREHIAYNAEKRNEQETA